MSFVYLLAALFLSPILEACAKVSCDANGLCFEKTTFDVEGSGFELGFAFPERQEGFGNSGELMASIAIALPYAFSAFSLGETTPSLNMVLYEFPFKPCDDDNPCDIEAQPNITFKDMVGQLSTALPNNTMVPFGNSRIAFSPLSPITLSATGTKNFTAIMRMQFIPPPHEIPDIFTSPAPRLTATFSENFPVYLSNVTHSALLPLDGADLFPFVLDAKAARFANYTEMLKVAQLV